MKRIIVRMLTLSPVLAGVLMFSGCEEKGPAEKAGEKLDKAADNAADALNPKGPAEKLGEKVDKATGK